MLFLFTVFALSNSAFAEADKPEEFRSFSPFSVKSSPIREIGNSGPISPSPEQVRKLRETLQEKPSPEEPLVHEEEPIAPPKPRLSPFETYIQGKDTLIAPAEVRQFGYELFEMPTSTFAPVEIIPVSPDYLLGPGDEIRISLWGKVSAEYSPVIDRDGKIMLPDTGVLHLSGLTFSEAKKFMEKEFSRYYKPSEVKMNVSMGSLRSIRIYVVGKARRPGSYTLSSLSTLVNALFSAGGPSKVGTMRDIQLRRNGETIVHFDMYDFLLRGDKTKDVRLMPEDVIFIPSIGDIAAIVGNVNNPAIYELNGKTSILELIEMAGGLNAIAFGDRIQVERILDKSRQVVFESNLKEVKDKNILVQPGDVIKTFPVVQDKRTVRLSGAVRRGGEFGFTPGMRIKDLIQMGGGLQYYANRKQAELTRAHVTDQGPKTEMILIDFEGALEEEPQNNIPLKEDDYLFVRAVPEWELYRTVSISGEVRFPGIYTVKKGETLSSVIDRAGGFTDKAYLRGAVFTRESVREIQQKQLNRMIERLERELLATGVTETAAALTAEEAKIMELGIKHKKEFISALKATKATGRVIIALREPDILKGSPYDIEWEEGDKLHVPMNPETVQVIGAVYNETAFVYDTKKRFEDYVELAGGYTRNADEKAAYILKTNGTAIRANNGLFNISWNKRSKAWEFTTQHGLEPGDTIVVPQKLEKIAWLREVKDITQILFQIAVAAAVVISI